MASQSAAEVREEVMEIEQEIASIKAKLRRLGTSSSNDDQPNSLEIVLLKAEDLPEDAKPHLSFQLSSPVEEGVLSKVYDPLDNDPPPEGSIIIFQSVETSTATLVVTASDADIPLGSSSPLEVATLCKRDPMEDDTKKKYTTELPIAIVPQSATAEEEAVADVAVDAKEKDEEDKSKTATATDGDVVAVVEAETVTEVTSIPPVCTATLRFTYTPSPKDQREDLYELLNKTSQRKATALEKLRKLSMAQPSSSAAASTTGASPSTSSSPSSSTAMTKPAVKPGFLNKKKGASSGKEPNRLRKMYDTMLGPNSYAMLGYGILKGSKNYIIFFGAMTFFHFRGQMLALPPPV